MNEQSRKNYDEMMNFIVGKLEKAWSNQITLESEIKSTFQQIGDLRKRHFYDGREFFDRGELIIPYGKYEGQNFHDVPLNYLDSVVGKNEYSFLSRQARKYVDEAMLQLVAIMGADKYSTPPNYSWKSSGLWSGLKRPPQVAVYDGSQSSV